jgi:hypothetical protein
MGEAQFWTATPDGRYAYYTEGEQLWRFDADSNTREALTPSGPEAEARGVVGAGADGSYVYFVAGGALGEGSKRRACKQYLAQEAEVEERFNKGLISEAQERAALAELQQEFHEEQEGKTPARTGCALYVRHDGETKQIAVLALTDDELSGLSEVEAVTETPFGDWRPNLGGRTAEVTPDGSNVVFESKYRLTGYDNLVNGEPAIEAFVYDATSERLSCVSCNPSGAPPSSAYQNGAEELLPTSAVGNTVSTYMLRWMSDDGSRVFFDSGQHLVPQDTDGQANVYEWEREGAPSCPQGVEARPNGGCVFLLSGGSGNSSHGALLVDASASGGDVFFVTRAKLVPQDRDENMKLYDAHVCSEMAPCPQEISTACTGTDCQGTPPSPPTFATPASATFAGAGNFPPSPSGKPVLLTRAEKLTKALRACEKRRVKRKRVSCEKRAHKRYGTKAAKVHAGQRGRGRGR